MGFYALNGKSLVKFTKDETKERICEVLETIREQNPGKWILLVLDKHGSHICEYTRKRAHQFGIDFIFLPSESPHLNPIKKVWANSSGRCVQSSSKMRANSRISSRMCSSK